ncbi:hypothetical protein EXIGLDRAFT_704353 [Exidia glandulosa HHB12029]|uniref:RNI-like protein n=1 Tax=Exidia glandulosa HHB12029 TaxID=1314781 RepID=A0A165KXW4_EXIGL|nr:hypothetical protein EXIGLDRAFT_704353 [Exidia glandulosa HHB12029]
MPLIKFTNLLRRKNLGPRVVAVDLVLARSDDDVSGASNRAIAAAQAAEALAVNNLVTTTPNLRRITVRPYDFDRRRYASLTYLRLPHWVMDALGSFCNLEELSGISIGAAGRYTGDIGEDYDPDHFTESIPFNLGCLRSLRSLRDVEWLNADAGGSTSLSSTFEALRVLEIRTVDYIQTDSAWNTLLQMELPHLTDFGFQVIFLSNPNAVAFLRKHGRKLVRIAFEELFDSTACALDSVCPNLTELEFWRTLHEVNHAGVSRVIVNASTANSVRLHWQNLGHQTSALAMTKAYPKLKVLLNRNLNDWNEVDSEWQELSDTLRQEGVLLLNALEEAWRPRLSRRSHYSPLLWQDIRSTRGTLSDSDASNSP